jgi:hypothetical protein
MSDEDRSVVQVEASLMVEATWATLVDLGVDLVIFGWIVALVVVVEPLGDGDSEVGEVDILVLRAGPSSVATCSPSRSILNCMA